MPQLLIFLFLCYRHICGKNICLFIYDFEYLRELIGLESLTLYDNVCLVTVYDCHAFFKALCFYESLDIGFLFDGCRYCRYIGKCLFFAASRLFASSTTP